MLQRWTATAVVLAALAAAGPQAAQAKTHRCAQIGFEAHSDNVAVGIVTRNLSCRAGGRVVRAVYRGDFSPAGFTCRSRDVEPVGLSYVRWYCSRGAARVRWLKY